MSLVIHIHNPYEVFKDMKKGKSKKIKIKTSTSAYYKAESNHTIQKKL